MSSLAAHLRVLGLDGHNVVVGSTLEDLGHTGQVHAHGELTVTAELVKAISAQVHGDEGHVAVVHGLKLNASIAAIPGGLIEQVLQGLQNLLQEVSLDKSGLKHFDISESLRVSGRSKLSFKA